MNDKYIGKIYRAFVEDSQISFNYRTASGSNRAVKGYPLDLRCNKNGSYYVALAQPGYGYGTFSLDKMNNCRLTNSDPR
jgi:predicted DNA-binding transcriptional regulator YafY